MIYAVYLTELLLYVCFSFLTGTFLLQLIPKNRKPTITIPKRGIQLSILGIALFSLMPIIYLISMLQENIGWFLTIHNVFSSFEAGKAWVFTLIISIFFYLFVSIFPVLKDKRYSAISLIFVILLIFTIGWAGHSASLTESSEGFIYHSIHLMTVSLWGGVLMVVGWFSKDKENWQAFLKWFSPVAASCFLLVILTGFMMMTLVLEVKDYANAWVLDYGQALLLKHLIILPIFLFAFINGFWAKRRLQNNLSFHPVPWIKAESLVLLLVFAATAVLGQQPPPHEIDSTLLSNGVSPLFHYIYGGTLQPPVAIEFGLNVVNGVLFFLSAAFSILALWSFARKAPALMTFLISLCFVLSIYMALITSIQ